MRKTQLRRVAEKMLSRKLPQQMRMGTRRIKAGNEASISHLRAMRARMLPMAVRLMKPQPIMIRGSEDGISQAEGTTMMMKMVILLRVLKMRTEPSERGIVVDEMVPASDKMKTGIRGLAEIAATETVIVAIEIVIAAIEIVTEVTVSETTRHPEGTETAIKMIVMAKRTLLTPTIEGERRAVAVATVTVMTLANNGMEAAQESEARDNQSRVIEDREMAKLHLSGSK